MYVPPEGSPYNCVDELWSGVASDTVDLLAEHGDRVEIIVCGDLNGRTGTSMDYIEGELNDRVPFPAYYTPDIEWPRYSQDKEVNSHGRKILSFCKENSLRIANGRLFDDLSRSMYLQGHVFVRLCYGFRWYAFTVVIIYSWRFDTGIRP